MNDQELTFGVSGLLYKSNVLMYDRQTESLWSQVKSRAVTGPLSGSSLKLLPSTLTSWEKWKLKHPDTEVLSPDTGHNRDYDKDPYADYYKSRSGLFGLFSGLFEGHEGKELVAGVTIGGLTKAYPLELLRQQGKTTDDVGERMLTFAFDSVTGALAVTDEAGETVPYVSTYWFVWKDIHPNTERFDQNNNN
jgi:hypothetical protein